MENHLTTSNQSQRKNNFMCRVNRIRMVKSVDRIGTSMIGRSMIGGYEDFSTPTDCRC